MEIEVYIWKMNKENRECFVEGKVHYNEQDIAKIALADYYVSHETDTEKYEYTATINKMEI